MYVDTSIYMYMYVYSRQRFIEVSEVYKKRLLIA